MISLCLEGEKASTAWQARAEVCIIGSGPAGAMFADTLARAGVDVLVVEEGPLITPRDMHAGSFGAMKSLYRDLGASVTRGRAPMPVVQGRAVGGTSVINGAISWRLPHDIWLEWTRNDPAFADAVPWSSLQAATDDVESFLGIAPTPEAVRGTNDRLMEVGAHALGLANRPIRRSVRGCKGTGRCLLGCPTGAKQSMDRTYLARAVAAGARVASGVRADVIRHEGGRVRGVAGRTTSGFRIAIDAEHVILAASAVQSPQILWRSRVRHGPVGKFFQAHPGFSVLGRFPEEVRAWEGSTQGHEVTGLRREGLKFEALGLDQAMLAARIGLVGRALREAIDQDLPHLASWAVAVRAEALGTVRPSRLGSAVRYALQPSDIVRARRGVRVLGELMFAAGAEWVRPGVAGFDSVVSDPRRLRALEDEAPLDARAYTGVMTHLFGSCRMHSNPTLGVVDLCGRHHHLKGLRVVDSSVFPSNTGVNPQTSILALSRVLAERFLADPGPALRP